MPLSATTRLLRQAILWTFSGLCIGLYSLPTLADSDKHVLSIKDAYVRGPLPGQTSTAAYMVLSNKSDATLSLHKLSSSIAEQAELHQSIDVDGQSRMRKLEHFALKAGETATFKPGGTHIMLTGINTALTQDQQIDITFCFGDFCQKVELPVISVLNETHTHHSHH